MSKLHKKNSFLGKICYGVSAALMIATLVSSLLPSKAVLADFRGKVYVCKYVGTPGIDERLQTGQNPIQVSVNTIPEPVVIGSYFPDKQGRSYVLGFVPMYPEPTRENCPPPQIPENASASVTTGDCSWTQEDGSWTPVTLDLNHASLTINSITYTSSQTINLSPGSYPYSWLALTGYTGSGSGTLDIKECKPGKPSASVTLGDCMWTPEAGSLTPVIITLNHASLTINGETYTTSQTIYLPPGEYPYTWKADPGYTDGSNTDVNGDNKDCSGSGTLVVKDCSPSTPSATVTLGDCTWTPEAGSLTPVIITLNHASLTINGETYTTSQTIYLPPGEYPYTWKADPGYFTDGSNTDDNGDNKDCSGSGTLVVKDCSPSTPSATVTLGDCTWTPEAGPLTPVIITLNHASLTINGVTYKESQTIYLPPGKYPYTWKADYDHSENGSDTNDYYKDCSGSGTLVVKDCTPENASASITLGDCSWEQTVGSMTPVSITLHHASLTIHGETFTTSQTINLPPGSYPYSWTADSGYIGNGSGTVDIGDCTPGTASASVTTGACDWDMETGSLTSVSITLEHASLTINSKTYTTSQTINLPPGSYPYSWTAKNGYIGSGSGTVVIGDCTPGNASASVTKGACKWNHADGSLTPVTLDLNHASLMINSTTYTTSQTISLPPGSYPYSWTADSGYIGNGSGTVVLGDCTPGKARASVTTGACGWSQATGSMTPVTLDLDHASLKIHGTTYTTSQIIALMPGSYPYSWKAEAGYLGNGSGAVDIGDCTPSSATVSVTTGTCSWTPAAGSLTPVTLDLNHASLMINGVTYTASETIHLPPGSYPYSWTAEAGYIGSGIGIIIIGDCTPGTASASVTTGDCDWIQATGSLTPVSITLEHASLTINNATYTTSQTISLPPGSYPYSWTAETGYIGNGSGTVVIGDCTPGTATVSVTTGACKWTQADGSLTPVTLNLDHASLMINSTTYTTSQTINLPPGSYSYSWTAEAGYIGSGSGTVVIGDCTPGTASASVTTWACNWTQATGSLTPVSITLEHASLTINGTTYTTSQTINLPPGSYPYSWTAETGYTGNGSGTVVIGDCTPSTASVSVTTGNCSWTQAAGSLTPVRLDLNHATLTINGVTYAASQTIHLPPGSYPYSWTAEDGYIGSGSGTVVIGDCTSGTASASVTTGACSWTQAGGSLTPVSITLNHASLTINGVTYTASQTINLPPGSYPYSWTAENGYIGSGIGTIIIGDCPPILIPVSGVARGLLN